MPSSELPERIGRYRIHSVLGRGAMGVVFRAHDPAIDRPVALKLVHTDLLGSTERAEYIARFQQEAQAAGRCNHPNIVAVYDFDLHAGEPFLAMEFITGAALQQLKEGGARCTPTQTISIGGQILDGLGTAHAAGVVHRDIKPANIMLTAQGRVKITDFGISRLDTSHLTGTGSVVGTPSYMSPEQCRGEPTDGRSDLFSTAVVLYELVTGSKPFAGRSAHEVWHKLLHEEPRDSAELCPEAPPALHAALRRALSKDPAARFPTAEAMATLLRGQSSPSPDLAGLAKEADLTVLAQRPDARPVDLGLDSTAMTTIERRLAGHLGPIAGILVRDAARQAETLDRFYDLLVANIPDDRSRQRFRTDVRSDISASQSRSGIHTGSGGPLPDHELARVQAALAPFVGPIARILVKRAAPGCSTVEQLWQRVAESVGEADRAAFLKSGVDPAGTGRT